MVTRRVSSNTIRSRLIAQGEHCVVSSASLERAADLKVLALDPQITTECLAQCRRPNERSAADELFDPAPGALDIVDEHRALLDHLRASAACRHSGHLVGIPEPAEVLEVCVRLRTIDLFEIVRSLGEDAAGLIQIGTEV